MLFLLDVLLIALPMVFSVHHYRQTKDLVDKIPIHFWIDGTPDRFAAASFFVLYPVLNVLIALMALIGAWYMPALFSVLFSLTVGTAVLLLCATQYFSVPISRGEIARIPASVYCPVLSLVGLSTIVFTIYSVFFTIGD
jgi:hypothetical protein